MKLVRNASIKYLEVQAHISAVAFPVVKIPVIRDNKPI